MMLNHAKWIEENICQYKCSSCGYTFCACANIGEVFRLPKYCQNCGSAMQDKNDTIYSNKQKQIKEAKRQLEIAERNFNDAEPEYFNAANLALTIAKERLELLARIEK